MIQATKFVTKWVYVVVRITLVFWMVNILYLYLIFLTMAAKNIEQIATFFLTGLVLVPFFLFPGAIGALGISREFFKKENDFPLFPTFWKYFKRDYTNAMKIGAIFTVIVSVFYISYAYYSRLLGTVHGLVFLFFIFIAIFYFAFLLPVIVDRQHHLRGYFHATTQLMVRHPLYMLTVIFEIFIVLYLSAKMMPSLLVFVCPGIISLLLNHFYITCIKREKEKNTLITTELNS